MSRINENIVKMLNVFAMNQQKQYILHWLQLGGKATDLLNHPNASPALKSAVKELVSEHKELQ